MKILKLDIGHSDAILELYGNTSKYMGAQVSLNEWSIIDNEGFNEKMFAVFSKTYLSNLNNFHSYGLFDNSNVLQCLISFYDSSDEPSWYYTMCRSRGDTTLLKVLFDEVIKVQEAKNRFKFYTLVNVKHASLLRRFTYSRYNDERYGYFDEYIVPTKTKCHYNNAWELLFKKTLLPVDTIVRCSYLKQEFRPKEPPVAGSL